MRDDTNNVEEGESVYDWVDRVLFNKTTDKNEESLIDWVDSVIAEYELHFDAWVVENGESPVLCIRAIRGDKVSGTAYLNATTPHRQTVRYAIQSIIKEVIQK